MIMRIAWLLLAAACYTGQPAPTPQAGAPAAPTAGRSCLFDGVAPCISSTPVRLDRELIAWSDWIADYTAEHGHRHPLGVTECRWVAELQQVLLCGSFDRRTMNPPLARAGVFIEVRERALIRRDDPMFQRYVGVIGGFDLRKDHPDPARPDMLQFYAAIDRACTTDAVLCSDPAEQAMRKLLERAWADKPNFVLLTFAHVGSIPDDEVVSHEVLHAQYFTSAPYREVIDAYWAGLTETQRAPIRGRLSVTYNPGDEELMSNEFQAYVLMSGGERAMLGSFVAQHREPLLARLAARGQHPVAVQRR